MEKGFYRPYFIVPKKGSGLRPILDLRVFNRALLKLSFKMLTQKYILTCVRLLDWFAVEDPKDAYFHVSILPQHRPFLRFAFDGQAFQYKVLPFGMSLSPCVFTKVAEAALDPQTLDRPLLSMGRCAPAAGVPTCPGHYRCLQIGLGKYAFPPVSLLAQVLCKVREDEEQVTLVAPYWPTRAWFSDLVLLTTAPPWQIPLRKEEFALVSASRPLETPRLVPGRDAEDLAGLPPTIVDTINQARATSTRHLYAQKWHLFADWCSSRAEDPQRCAVSPRELHLQDRICDWCVFWNLETPNTPADDHPDRRVSVSLHEDCFTS
ncbi:uncharacterized protein LOC127628011 [Xyrauchen texanus]|uniref:uncharacterized protein LOC127628011 n=1 Tax=Xyrauchen texanus TaxID=154827 RepID=UPI002241E510|nr:uncharacterized protein LOC127628011 [Xyrauchen texanus]